MIRTCPNPDCQHHGRRNTGNVNSARIRQAQIMRRVGNT